MEQDLNMRINELKFYLKKILLQNIEEFKKMMDPYSKDKMRGRGLGFTYRQKINIFELLDYIYNENESFEIILDYRKKLFELKKQYGKEWMGLSSYILTNEEKEEIEDEHILILSNEIKNNDSELDYDDEYNKKLENLKFFYPYYFYEDNDKINRLDERFKYISFTIGKADELVQEMIKNKIFNYEQIEQMFINDIIVYFDDL